MAVAAYTDLFNKALDDVTTTLTAITGLSVTNDPRNITPPCAMIEAPQFEAYNYNLVKLSFPIRLIAPGPANLDAQRTLMNMAAKVLAAKVAVTDGRPTIAVNPGGGEYPAYDLTIEVRAQTE